MRYIRRQLEKQVLQAVKGFPAVVLTGPRRAGKTLLLRRLFPKASYFLLEDPDVVARLRADPQGFLDAVPTPQSSTRCRTCRRCSRSCVRRSTAGLGAQASGC